MNGAPLRGSVEEAATPPNPALVITLRVLLLIEAAAMVGVAGWLLVELLTATPASFTTAVAVVVIAVIAAAFVTAFAIASLRGRPWIRGAALVWQIVQLAVAVGCFQGLYARPDLGWALLVPSVVVIVLLLLPSVRSAYARAD